MIKPDLVQMTSKELSRIKVIEKVIRKEITQVSATEALKVTDRQVRRLVKKYLKEGPEGLASRKRGKESNNKTSTEEVDRLVDLINTLYSDFGPTLAHEKLVDHHGATVSVETLRQVMIEKCGWIPKSRKAKPVHQSRKRRSRFGELVQIDGSPHAWFEDRGPECSLMVFIDDATGAYIQLKFYPSETTQAYMEMTKSHVEMYGRPLAYYSDKHSIFRSTKENGEETQYGRALKELEIDLICASSPQAKGRVERANKTLQDRLVKELRLRGINDIESANEFLNDYRQKLNEKFARDPRDDRDAHQPNIHSKRELELVLSGQEQRIVTKNLEVHYQNKIFQLPRGKHRLKGAKITVCDLFGSQLPVILYEGKEISYNLLEKDVKLPEEINDKCLNQKVDEIAKKKGPKRHWKPASNHPWRLDSKRESLKKKHDHQPKSNQYAINQ